MDARVRRFGDLVTVALQGPAPVRLVGVDGCGGAGKTTFARRLAQAAGGAPVVPTDDFASYDEPTQWWPRFLDEVVEPLLRGEPAHYHPYDWVSRRMSSDTIIVAPAPLVIIEGVGATRAAWRDRLTLRIWVHAPRAERLRRGLARDGEHMRDFWQWWMAAEDAYVAEEDPVAHADVLVDGAAAVPYDPDTEYVELPRRATDRAATPTPG